MSDFTILLDFGANRSIGRKRVFSNSLEDQFKNLPLGDDFEDFIRDKFIRNDCKVLISYPNFRRERRVVKNGLYYDNVALRFPNMEDDGRDIVLMCDIFERNQNPEHPERPIQRTFQVKSILLMDPNVIHYGEIERTCKIFINTSEKREEMKWESEDWIGKWPSDDSLRFNILSNDFLLELNDNYVVQLPEEVKAVLKNWRRYIESREYLIGEDSRNGYDLGSCLPEFFKAYNTSGDVSTSDYGAIEYLDSKAKEWTLDRVNEESREALLMHIYIEVLEKDYLISKGTRDDLKRRLDRFTRDPLFLGYGNAGKSVGKQERKGLRIADRRLYTSTLETVEPTDDIESIRADCATRIESAKKRNEDDFASDVDTRLRAFEQDELPGILEKYASEQRTPITNRVSADLKSKKADARDCLTKELDVERKRLSEVEARIGVLKKDPAENSETKSKNKSKGTAGSSLEGLESSLSETKRIIQDLTAKIDGLDEEYNPEKAINKAIDEACKAYRLIRIAEEKESIESGLRAGYDERLDYDIALIESDANNAIQEAKRERNIARFHLFFEIEVSDDETIDRKIRTLSQFGKTGLKLSRDLTGDEIILKRQKDALDNLEEGYVLNPFLATFLFSPRSGGTGLSIQMDDENFIDKSLNDSQKEAVRMALSSNGLFLIQGPPGTGKTQVIAEISAQLASSDRKVLIASQNNKAVDNAFDRIPKIPSVRLLRVLSEKATKRGNNYSIDELVRNFYTNLSESMDDERRNMENRTSHVEELESSIRDLSLMYRRIEACRDDAKDTDDAIAKKEDALKIAYQSMDELEDSNRSTEDQIEQMQGTISSVEDLSDDKTFKMIVTLVEGAGLTSVGRNGDPRNILRSLHSIERGSIIKEYASIEEHRVYFG